MSLKLFTVITEAHSNDAAFAAAQQSPVMGGRIFYSLIDGTTVFPSDKHALLRAEDYVGVQPQDDRVYLAGDRSNTVWALRIHAPTGIKRLLFFGLQRV